MTEIVHLQGNEEANILGSEVSGFFYETLDILGLVHLVTHEGCLARHALPLRGPLNPDIGKTT